MAGLSEVRASTPDPSAGIQVATATNELDGVGTLQATVPMGNKSTFTEVARTGLTTDDTGTTDLTSAGFGSGLVDLGNCLSLLIRVLCNTAGGVLTGIVIFYDAAGNPVSYSELLTFTADTALTVAASGQKYPAARLIIDAGSARQAKFYVKSISGGTWNVYMRPI